MIRIEIELLLFYGFLILLMVMIHNDLILKSHYQAMKTGRFLISPVRFSYFMSKLEAYKQK